jgi:hypothetical protein
VSNGAAQVPPLFWIGDLRGGLPLSVALSGYRAICFFSTPAQAENYAEHHLNGQPGVDWLINGSNNPSVLFRTYQVAPRMVLKDLFTLLRLANDRRFAVNVGLAMRRALHG